MAYRSIATETREADHKRRLGVTDTGVERPLMVPPLSHEIANRITSRYNQNYSALVCGPFGSGKSFFSLYTAWRTAQRLAEKLENDIDKWPNYFNIDTNCAIISEEEALKMIASVKKHNVYMLDDVGPMWGARDFSTDLNKLLNNIFQTMRTENTALLITVPAPFLVDIVPRSLVNQYDELELSLFDYGMVLAKVFDVAHKPRSRNKVFNIYPRYGPAQVVRYIGRLPPKELTDAYAKRREESAAKVRQERKEKGSGRPTKKSLLYPGIYRLIHEKHLTQKEACEVMGVALSSWKEWAAEQA